MTVRGAAKPTIRSAQAILLAMLGGLAIFAVAAGVLELSTSLDAGVKRVLLLGLAVLAGVEIPVYFLLRMTLLRRLGARKDEALAEARRGELPAELMALAVAGAALAEGVGLLGCTIVLLTRLLPVLAAPALAVLLIAFQIPTQERVENQVRAAAKESH